jgi:hypothetical protein
MKIVVDGIQGTTAHRFPSTDMARDYCQTQEACFTVDYWAVHTWGRGC